MKKSQERLAETEKVALTQTTPMTVMEQEMTSAIDPDDTDGRDGAGDSSD